jgi:hypothetical protein
MAYNNYNQFTTRCTCGAITSKAFARANNGKCKACVTGIPKAEPRGLECPTCHGFTLTAYQKKHGYHCDNCTREADPEGYRREVMGLNDYPEGGNW